MWKFVKSAAIRGSAATGEGGCRRIRGLPTKSYYHFTIERANQDALEVKGKMSKARRVKVKKEEGGKDKY